MTEVEIACHGMPIVLGTTVIFAVILYSGANFHAQGPNPGFHSGFRKVCMVFAQVDHAVRSCVVSLG